MSVNPGNTNQEKITWINLVSNYLNGLFHPKGQFTGPAMDDDADDDIPPARKLRPTQIDKVPVTDDVSITVVPMWQDTVVIKGHTYEIGQWHSLNDGKLIASLNPVGHEINDNPGIPNEKTKFLCLPMKVVFHGEINVTDSDDLTVHKYGLLIHMNQKIYFDDPAAWFIKDVHSMEKGDRIDLDALKIRIAKTSERCVKRHMRQCRNRPRIGDPKITYYLPELFDEIQAAKSFTLLPGLDVIYSKGQVDMCLYVLGYIRLTGPLDSVIYTLAVERYVADLLDLRDPDDNEALSVLGYRDQAAFRRALRHQFVQVFLEKELDPWPMATIDVDSEWVSPRRFWKDKVLTDNDEPDDL